MLKKIDPKTLQWIIGLLGAAAVAIAHAPVLDWRTVLTIIGSLITGGQLFPRSGDVPVDQLPVDIRESLRPPPLPSDPQ